LIQSFNIIHRVIKGMKKVWLIAIILLVFTTISMVSASGPIYFSHTGDLVVTYVSGTAGYNDEFGIVTSKQISLGFTKGDLSAVPGATYQSLGHCTSDEPVVLYCKSPPEGGSVTYYSNQTSGDGFDHAVVTMQEDGSYRVGFEDMFGARENPAVPGDGDYDDVVLNVACIRYSAPPFEGEPVRNFPVMALPAGFICGIIGSALYIHRTREP
jgi:hypothetical protein